MTRVVPVQPRKEIISRNILGRRDIMQVPRKDFQRRKVGSFFDESSLKEKLRKLTLYAGNQAILQEIARKRRKQQSSLNKPRSMQKIFLSRIQSLSFPWTMNIPLKPWQLWFILPRKKTQNQTVNMIQTQKSKPSSHPNQ